LRQLDTLWYRLKTALDDWFVDVVWHDIALNPKLDSAEMRYELCNIKDMYDKRKRIINNIWLDPDNSPRSEELLEDLKKEKKIEDN